MAGEPAPASCRAKPRPPAQQPGRGLRLFPRQVHKASPPEGACTAIELTAHLDINRIMSDVDSRQISQLEVSIDWAPAYELVVSLEVFVFRGKHVLVELGQSWADDVRSRLPADFVQRANHAGNGFKGKHEDDLLMLLVRACPGNREASAWLDWLSELSPGEAYEALAHQLPETGPRLPRDFVDWRDRTASLLRAWNASYFGEVEPEVLEGLQRDAERVRGLIGTLPPRDLVEQVTNGMSIEPGPGTWRVELVPQYHLRPYNHDCPLADGIMILYPAEILPPPPDAPPLALMRLTRGLGDESRLRILRFLSEGPRSLTEVARFAGLSQPTVHHHLSQLRSAGLVRIHCSLSSPMRYSLRTHALEQLALALGSYLEPGGS
jgi:DNA-binding transcriptional ArsR family regulator